MRKSKCCKYNNIFLLCIIVLIVLIVIFCGSLNVFAENTDRNLVNIYFFHSNSCSHCKSEEKLLDDLEKKYSNVKIYRYEVHDDNNRELFKQVQNLYDVKTDGVPLTIIGGSVYTGYHEERGKVQFIKTIEYYSKYGYIDKMGNFLKLDLLPTYSVEQDSPEFEEFFSDYGNYKLVGNIYTDDFDMSTNAIILGILSQFTWLKVLAFIVIFFFFWKIKKEKVKITLLFEFLILSNILIIESLVSNLFFSFIIVGLLLIYVVYRLLKYRKFKNKEDILSLFFIFFIILVSYADEYFVFSYSSIFRELVNLYVFDFMDKFIYYFQYLFMIFNLNLLFILLFIYFNKRFFGKVIN